MCQEQACWDSAAESDSGSESSSSSSSKAESSSLASEEEEEEAIYCKKGEVLVWAGTNSKEEMVPWLGLVSEDSSRHVISVCWLQPARKGREVGLWSKGYPDIMTSKGIVGVVWDWGGEGALGNTRWKDVKKMRSDYEFERKK